jgi:hypothetical protein
MGSERYILHSYKKPTKFVLPLPAASGWNQTRI